MGSCLFLTDSPPDGSISLSSHHLNRSLHNSIEIQMDSTPQIKTNLNASVPHQKHGSCKCQMHAVLQGLTALLSDGLPPVTPAKSALALGIQLHEETVCADTSH